VTTDEKLEATYVVRYFVDLPEIPPQNDKLPKLDYIQAINVAARWITDDRQIDIFDDRLPIFLIDQKGVQFIKYEPLHVRFVQHLKIKIALDKVWGNAFAKAFKYKVTVGNGDQPKSTIVF
jgi:hypothetical protein